MNQQPPDFKKLWMINKPVIISLAILASLYLLLRLPNLTSQPIFADEAIYIRWAQIMRAEPTLRFLPMTDGKQPLFMWLVIPFLKVFSDPLLAGRNLSVLAGLGSLFGLFWLTLQLTKSQKHALTASFLYAITPFALFFDRMALVDSLLTMFGIWGMLFSVKLLQKPQLLYSILAGILFGFAWLTKSPAMVMLGLLPFTGLTALPPKDNGRKLKTGMRLNKTSWYWVRVSGFWLLIVAIAFGIYNILRLGPEFHQIALRNADYIYSFNEILSNPGFPLLEHLYTILGFYWFLLTPAIFVSAFLGLLVLVKQRLKLVLFLSIWFLIPLFGQATFARNVTARYFLYILPPVIILASMGVQWLLTRNKQILWKGIVIAVAVVPALWQVGLLLIVPEKASLPRVERHGYFEEWTSGYGLREVANYISREANASTVVVGTEGFFGTMPDGLQIYFDKEPRVTVLGHPPIVESIDDRLYDSLDANKVYFLVNDTRMKIKDYESAGLKLIKSFPKAARPDGTRESLLFFEMVKDSRI